MAAAIAEADANFASAREAATARFEQRKVRIGKAYQASKETVLQRIEDRMGARKYDLQKRMLQAERDRDSGLANAATTLQEFKTNLAAEQEALAQLEQSAQGAFKGHRKLVHLLAAAREKAAPISSQDENQMLLELRDLIGRAGEDLRRFRKFLLLRWFKYWPAWVVMILCEIPLVLQRFGLNADAGWKAGGCVLASLVVLFALRYVAQRNARPLATAIADSLGKARRLHDTAFERSEAHYQQELERIKTEFETTTRTVDLELKQTVARAGELRVACRMENDGKATRVLEKNERLHHTRLQRLERSHAGAANHLKLSGGSAPECGGRSEHRPGEEVHRQLSSPVAEARSRMEQPDSAHLRGH